ncbi:hypothetical protein Q31b_06980 [Novipirellula aureliae]|uniref:Uncharacterized protein n=1 Tax=Novipirellula aureliae TaxID=2527966 RepID=A0A5C6EAL0_9BACT|nr:hypothetical protein [Novipirellula aureliae]TWU45524.1 hypothetical protein Q31b_06980 [Novipirellula aureliae]
MSNPIIQQRSKHQPQGFTCEPIAVTSEIVSLMQPIAVSPFASSSRRSQGGSGNESVAYPIGSRRRLAVTLIEVVFSIGVILIGLVGLMSILPLAGHRAQDSIDFSVGAAVADSVADEILARDLISSGTLALADGITAFTRTTQNVGGTDFVFVEPFCVDPLLIADRPIQTESGTPSSGSFNAAVFPMFGAVSDPLLNPSTANSLATTGFANQPRMARLGLPALGLTANQRLEVARTLVERFDDINFVRPKDRSLPASLNGLTAVSNGVEFGRSVPTGEYSWIVTVDPDQTSRYASMSVVVLRNRDRVTEFPNDDTVEPASNIQSERLAYVANSVGFTGGSGGQVTLLWTGNITPNLRSNDWVMLSRTLRPTTSPASPLAQRQVHRWYRVVSTDAEAQRLVPTSDTEVDGITVPSSSGRTGTEVWKRTVMLSGPDWAFDASPHSGGNFATYATIMDGVVSVTERTISLADF